ncbi:MAG: NAD(FAD)-utilizing dehydrogenase [Clostridiales bacterium]|nr:NAD(FAD)-utilizing dehydrogenase [Candidatus Crickella merdequi]
MHYRINEIKLNIGESKDRLPGMIEKKLRLKPGMIIDWELRRESIDARNKQDIRLVYTVDFWCDRRIDPKMKGLKANQLMLVDDSRENPVEPVAGSERLSGRPLIVGFGPCGIFAALELARRGYRPLVIERGAAMEERVEDVEAFRAGGELKLESNMLFGEGGAGTFSDGKLTSGIRNGHIRQVLADFCRAGAGEDIMYLHRPHIGTDVLREVIVNLRKEIISLGGQVRFGTRLDRILLKDGELCGAEIVSATGRETVETNAMILAVGHSARDTFKHINELGMDIQQKPFSIGVRMEHPQVIIDRAQYGSEDRLPPADYKLAYHAANGRGVYSFCMCPGGEVVVCSNSEGEISVNGMSNRKRDSGTANSGILCDVRTSDFDGEDPLAGVRFQEKYERLAFENGGRNYKAPSCSMGDFLAAEGSKAEAVIASMPEFASEAIREAVPFFAKKIKGYDMPEAVITAVETRSSSPIRILRNGDCESNIKGIYPAGEGAGYAGGITSAACDGIKAAQSIISRFAAE